MLAQGGAGVFLAEQATALEFGHDELDELLIGARDVGGGDDEAVARTLDEPLLHLVGDLLRAADEGDLGAAAAGDLHEVAHGRVPLAGDADDEIAGAVATGHAGQPVVGERPAPALPGEVSAHHLGPEANPRPA